MRMEQGIKSFALVGAIGACVFATVPLWLVRIEFISPC
ncbi:hypothetical protein QFZ80_001143 [Paenibacillus sp. V4I7]|nr:hypothetical protein [Paenibacillus sp. V4I7]MDQ0916538.1 hypothetical protein [Paenibacillus sp. V4I5]